MRTDRNEMVIFKPGEYMKNMFFSQYLYKMFVTWIQFSGLSSHESPVVQW